MIARMYERHDHFNTPDEDATIWRYMTWPKLCSMMTEGGLFFVRADCFEDPWEALYPPAHFKRENVMPRIQHLIDQAPERADEFYEQEVAQLRFIQKQRQSFRMT